MTDKLQGVHPDLVRVVRAAESGPVKFRVTEGVRSIARQRALVMGKKSRTMRSRHLTGHAVDLAVMIGNTVVWEWPHYQQLAAQVKEAARNEGVPIEWGGDWATFKDGPHFQLPHDVYPEVPSK